MDLAGLVRPFRGRRPGSSGRSAAPGVAELPWDTPEKALYSIGRPATGSEVNGFGSFDPPEHRCNSNGRRWPSALWRSGFARAIRYVVVHMEWIDPDRRRESWPTSSGGVRLEADFGTERVYAIDPRPQAREVTRGAGPLPSSAGAAALLFETLWFQAGLARRAVWAASLITASFMAGLAAGNAGCRWGRHCSGRWPSTRPWRPVALSGVAIIAMPPHPRGRVRVATAGRAS